MKEVALRTSGEHGTELEPTPTENTVAFRAADFSTLCEALDYSALGQTGCNFYGSRGELCAVLSYADLREQAVSLARKLLSLRLDRGARVAIIAETDPNFHRMFFACQYAGLVPVPVSASALMSGRQAYVAQLKALLGVCRASVAMAPSEFYPFLAEAAEELNIPHVGMLDAFERLPESQEGLRPSEPHEVAYLQYTSGSTLFPRGVVITQKAVLANLNEIIIHGLKLRPRRPRLLLAAFLSRYGACGIRARADGVADLRGLFKNLDVCHATTIVVVLDDTHQSHHFL